MSAWTVLLWILVALAVYLVGGVAVLVGAARGGRRAGRLLLTVWRPFFKLLIRIAGGLLARRARKGIRE